MKERVNLPPKQSWMSVKLELSTFKLKGSISIRCNTSLIVQSFASDALAKALRRIQVKYRENSSVKFSELKKNINKVKSWLESCL